MIDYYMYPLGVMSGMSVNSSTAEAICCIIGLVIAYLFLEFVEY